MNRERRKRLAALGARIDDLVVEVRELADEELEAYEAIPESLQGSERAQAMDECADRLGAVSELLDEASHDLADASGDLS